MSKKTSFLASYRVRSTLVVLAWAMANPAHSLAQSSIKVDLKSSRTHGRLSLEIDESVRPVWKSDSKGFSCFLPGLDLADLGLGTDHQVRPELFSKKDPRLQSIRIQEQKGGVMFQGKWVFPTGPQTLAQPVMETFSFRQAEPARYLVDFWIKAGPTLRQAKLEKISRDREESIQRAIAESKKRTFKRRSVAKKVETTGDPLRFCREPFNETTDVVLPFRPVVRQEELAKWIPSQAPDQDYPYFESQDEGLENDTIRLALNLYRESKPALAIKTLEFYERDFSKSSHMPEMLFLKANVFLKLNMVREAERIFQTLLVDHQKHPVALFAGLYMAAEANRRGETLAALEHFMWLERQHPQHELSWVFHLGAAESLFAMKQTERASKEYQWVYESKAPMRARILASQRIGDLFLERMQYEQALAAYYKSIREFPKGGDVYPEIFLNRGEVLVGLQQWDRARSELERFVSKYPNHTNAWRAKIRLAEIAARRGGAGLAEAERWYVRTINEHPTSGGAVLAQLRLIPCGNHGGFQMNSAQSFFDREADTLPSVPEKSREIVMDQYPELLTLVKIRTWLSFGDYPRVLDYVLQNLDRTKPVVVRDRLSEAYRIAFRQQSLRYLEEGKNFEAIAFFQEYGTKLPVSSAPPSLNVELSDVYLRLAHVASQMEMGSMVERLVERAIETGSRVPADASQDLDTALHLSQAHYLKAKSLWLVGSPELQIREELSQIADESPFSGEREWMLGALEEKNGNIPQAIHHLSKAALLVDGASTSGVSNGIRTRMQLWLADLHAKAGGRSTAREIAKNLAGTISKQISRAPASYQNIDPKWSYLPLPRIDSAEEVLLREAEWWEQDSKWLEASRVYGQVIKQGFTSNHNLFLYARALSRLEPSPEQTLAIQDSLKRITESKEEDFWKKLAQEALANQQLSNPVNTHQATNQGRGTL